jgi:hypothetical protein
MEGENLRLAWAASRGHQGQRFGGEDRLDMARSVVGVRV